MRYLILNVLSQTAFMHLFRLSQVRGQRPMPVAMVNYIVAALAAAALGYAISGQAAFHMGWLPLLCGVVNGALFVASLYLTLGSFKVAGVGITSALTASSLVIPSFVGWLVWHESLRWTGWLALVLVVPAMFLMRPHSPIASLKLTRAQELTLGGCLLVAGAINVIHKLATIQINLLPAPDASRLGYSSVLFGAAAIGTALASHFFRDKLTLKSAQMGAGIGIVNVLTMLTLMKALNQIESVVFFPVAGCLLIISTNLTSRVLWSERIQPRQIVGIVLAISVVALASV